MFLVYFVKYSISVLYLFVLCFIYSGLSFVSVKLDWGFCCGLFQGVWGKLCMEYVG